MTQGSQAEGMNKLFYNLKKENSLQDIILKQILGWFCNSSPCTFLASHVCCVSERVCLFGSLFSTFLLLLLITWYNAFSKFSSLKFHITFIFPLLHLSHLKGKKKKKVSNSIHVKSCPTIWLLNQSNESLIQHQNQAHHLFLL